MRGAYCSTSGRFDRIVRTGALAYDAPMELQLYQEVALTRSVPGTNLRAGDVAMLVDIASHSKDGEDGAVLEIFNAVGESIAVVTVPLSAVARLRADQVPTVRTLAAAD